MPKLKKTKKTKTKKQNCIIKRLKKHTLYLSLTAMAMLITGVFLPWGSLAQKILFLVGAGVMTLRAFIDKVTMFKVLECVIVVGSTLAFFPTLPSIRRYSVMWIAAVIAVIYLIKIKLYEEDHAMFLWTAGLVALAIGFATNAVTSPILFNILLGGGAIALAAYSSVYYFWNKVRISMIFMILNIIFAIKPIIYLIDGLCRCG